MELEKNSCEPYTMTVRVFYCIALLKAISSNPLVVDDKQNAWHRFGIQKNLRPSYCSCIIIFLSLDVIVLMLFALFIQVIFGYRKDRLCTVAIENF